MISPFPFTQPIMATVEDAQRDALATLFTFTTYGTWLRGDHRGWVDEGRTLPPDPVLEDADRQRMKHDVLLFPRDNWLDIGNAIGRSLIDRAGLRILALTVRSWHVHFVIGITDRKPAVIAKCAKDAARYHLRPGRPIWTHGYDKRFCYDEQAVMSRILYVERHNTEVGLPPQPWDFLVKWRE